MTKTSDLLWTDPNIDFGDGTELPILLARAKAYNAGHHAAVGSPHILTPEEVAERLKVPVSWVYDKQRTRCKNPIPSKPLGRYVRFDWDEVVKWLGVQSNIKPEKSNTKARKRSG